MPQPIWNKLPGCAPIPYSEWTGLLLLGSREHPKPMNWKATTDDILQKVKRAWQSLHDCYAAQKPSAALASIERYFNPPNLTPAPT